MRLLVDTHVVIWALVDPERLSKRVRGMIEDPGADLIVSAATAYEIEFKRGRDSDLGRLPLDLERALTGLGFTWLPVTASHASMAGRLPRHHGDPFDRILIAQALAEGMPLLSADRNLPAYGAEVIW
jgi:PIN domain nuclease of toxin-antitoxin system